MSPWLVALAALGGLALGAAAAELAARWWLKRHGRYNVWPPGYRGRYEVDLEAFPMLEPVVEWSVNADGERGDPLPRELAGTYRVVAAGGSTTECYFLDQKSTWPAILQELLRAPEALARLGARDAYVGNIGRSVTTTGYLADILERVLDRYPRLDLVVLFVGASDLVRWMHARAPREWTDDPVPVERIYAQHPEGPFGWSPRRLALRRLASALVLRVRRPLDVRTRIGKHFVELRRMRAEAPYLITEEPDIAPVLTAWEANLRRTFALLQGRARRVLFVPNPWFEGGERDPEARRYFWNFGLGAPHQERLDTYYAHDVVARMLRRLADAGIAVARECGVEALDLAERVERTRENYYDYLHHTPAGNRRVAEEIAREVLRADAAPNDRGQDLRAAAGKR